MARNVFFTPLKSDCAPQLGRDGTIGHLLRLTVPTYAWLRFLSHACCISLVFLAVSIPLAAQTDHPVHIGLNNQLAFTDAASGTNITVVLQGDTVTWTWDYIGIQHTTSSGLCTSNVPGVCTLNGIWDSGFRFNPPPPPTFTRQFNDLGTFPYFCQVHGPDFGMRGKVVVLNGPDFGLDINNNNSNFFPPPPIPTMVALPNQSVNFSGKLTGFLGYNNLVNLSCQNGSPRTPDNCPAQSATPSALPNGTAFNFSVADSTPGDYTFNITGTGTDAANLTHSQQVKLSVSDLALTPPSPNPVTVVTGQNSAPGTFQVKSLNNFSGFVSLNCSGLGGSARCNFNPSFIFNASTPPVQNVTFTVSTGSATPGIYSAQIVASTSGTFFVNRSQNLTVRILPAHHFNVQVSPNTKVTAGTAFNVTVSAMDAADNRMQSYAGSVHFSSSDSSISASLPADYTFTVGPQADNGTHTFNITLPKPETLTITAADSLFNDLTVTTPLITVVPANRLGLQVPVNVAAGTPFNLVVTALDHTGNPAQIYADTIHFTSSDPAILVQLPDYTFTGQGMGLDNGTHTFPLTFTRIEPVTITITDISFPGLFAATPLILVANDNFHGTVNVTSSREGQAPPHFAVGAKAATNGSVTFTATVTLNSGDPAGNIHFFDGTNDLGTVALSAPVNGTATASLTLDGVTQQLRLSGHIIVGVYEPTSGTGNLGMLLQTRSPAPHCDSTRCP